MHENGGQIILLCVWESLGKVGRLLKIPLDLEFQDGG